MKIYINNFNLEILNDISEQIKEYIINSETYITLYTGEGIYNIEDKNIYILEPYDKDIKKYDNYYKNFTLIVDPSYFNIKNVNSIHGENHITFNTIKQIYKLNKKSDIQLIIKFCFENKKIIPNDIYFEITKDIDINEVLIKKELIEFLSLLN